VSQGEGFCGVWGVLEASIVREGHRRRLLVEEGEKGVSGVESKPSVLRSRGHSCSPLDSW
jgi:hypothetical protein